MREKSGFSLLTLFLGQICVANHSWLYRHIRSPLPTMSVIHINTFHTCDTFPCFFGFKNTNDTEIARVKSHGNWCVTVTKYVAIIVTQQFVCEDSYRLYWNWDQMQKTAWGKPVDVNPGLNALCKLSCTQMFFTSNVWCSLRLLQLKTEGQTI